jgi:phosphatidylglycerol:prolipoprotein diacylglycerol transferase
MYWFNSPPAAIIFTLGPINFYWYGLIMVLSMLAAYLLVWRLAQKNNWRGNDLLDLIFNIIVAGLIGARFYHVLIHWSDYSTQLLDILKVWQGGLAIHGGLLGGLLALWLSCRRRYWPFWQLTAWLTPGVAIGQAIGRWGNFFNQELFGPASTLPWAIPIDIWHRPINALAASHFQPLFFYESMACLVLAILLYRLNRRTVAPPKIVGIYLVGYGIIRLTMEFFRQDPTLYLLGWRWPQWLSLILILFGLSLIILYQQPAAKFAKK